MQQKHSKRIVILGGGYGGVLTAKHLARGIKKQQLAEQVDLCLIDQRPYHTMLTELHEVAAGRVEEQAVRMDFDEIFYGRGVRVLLDRIACVDYSGRVLRGERGEYPFDYLVLAAGSRPAYFDTPGAQEHSFPLWSYDDAVRLRQHIQDQFRTAMEERDPGRRGKLLTFVVVGAGFTGVEIAGELGEWVPVLCRDFDASPAEVSVRLLDLQDRLLPALPRRLTDRIARRLERLGVQLSLETGVEQVGEDFVLLGGRGGSGEIGTGTVIWTAGTQAAQVLEEPGMLVQKDRGRVQVTPTLEAVGCPGVFVVGDNLLFTPKGTGEAVPQMVENAEASAALVAHNLLAELSQAGEKREYAPSFHGMMVSVGGRWGAAWIGTPRKKLALTGFFALLAKHLVNLVYFVQVLGLQQCLAYLRREVFQIRDRRSLAGGYFSRNAPNFWLVPFRMFLGIMWLLEFWSKWPKLLENPKRIFLFPLPGADGVASATVEASVDALGAAAYGTALPVPTLLAELAQWGMAVFVAPVAPLAQAVLIFMELALGLAFLAGCLTPLAAAASAGMCAMIYLSGMAGQEILWYFFGSIALLGGGGSAFSFDYYLLPWLKRKWNSLEWVKRWYGRIG